MWARLTSERKEKKRKEKKSRGRRWAGPTPQAGLLSRVPEPAFLAVNRAGHSFEPWAKPS